MGECNEAEEANWNGQHMTATRCDEILHNAESNASTAGFSQILSPYRGQEQRSRETG